MSPVGSPRGEYKDKLNLPPKSSQGHRLSLPVDNGKSMNSRASSAN